MFNYSKFIWFNEALPSRAFKTLDINRMSLGTLKTTMLDEARLKQFLRMKQRKITERQLRRQIDFQEEVGLDPNPVYYKNQKIRREAMRGIMRKYIWQILRRLRTDDAFLRKIIVKYARTDFLKISYYALQLVKPNNNLFAYLVTASHIKDRVRLYAFDRLSDDDFKVGVLLKRIRKRQRIDNWPLSFKTRKAVKEIYDALLNTEPEYQKGIYANTIAIIKREFNPRTAVWKRWVRTERK